MAFLRPCELWGPVPSEKATDQSKIMDSGSQSSLQNYNMQFAQILFLQKSLHPNIDTCTVQCTYIVQVQPI